MAEEIAINPAWASEYPCRLDVPMVLGPHLLDEAFWHEYIRWVLVHAVWRKSVARRLNTDIYDFTDMLASVSHRWRLHYDWAGRAWVRSARLEPSAWLLHEVHYIEAAVHSIELESCFEHWEGCKRWVFLREVHRASALLREHTPCWYLEDVVQCHRNRFRMHWHGAAEDEAWVRVLYGQE
jgi:hypothetical protein